MKVIVVSGSKFHAFHLAEQLDKRGYLYKLVTLFYSKKRGLLPNFRDDKEEINVNKVVVNPFPALVSKGLEKIPIVGKILRLDCYLAETFDKWSSTQIDKCDLIVAWSGWALHTIKAAKKFGALTVLERGSAHILFQKRILEEEYNKYGVKHKPVDDFVLKKELSEYNETNYICVPSNYAKETFVNEGVDLRKIINIPHGVDLSYFKQIKKTDDTFRVIFVGSLMLRKGVQYLIPAFQKLKLRNSELVLIGTISPDIINVLKKYEGMYKYVPHVPHYELYKYYSQGSVFILPSLEDGFGLVVTEAMACGLPVICTENTGSKDLIREGKDGFIIPIRNESAIMDKIMFLYKNNDLCLEMGKSAFNHVSKGYDWNCYGEKIVQIFKEKLRK